MISKRIPDPLTLTGALTGTSATFSGAFQANTVLSIGSISTYAAYTIASGLSLSKQSATNLHYQSQVADNAAAIAHRFDTDSTYSTAGSLIASFQNNGSTKASVDRNGLISTSGGVTLTAGTLTVGSGTWVSGAGLSLSTPVYTSSAAGTNVTLRGAGTDGADANGTRITNGVAMTNATANIVGFFPDDGTTRKLAIHKSGKLRWPTGGADDVAGTATLVAGTVTVNTTAVATGSLIFVSRNTPGGTAGHLSAPVASITNVTSFVINSSDAADTSTVNWVIVN